MLSDELKHMQDEIFDSYLNEVMQDITEAEMLELEQESIAMEDINLYEALFI